MISALCIYRSTLDRDMHLLSRKWRYLLRDIRSWVQKGCYSPRIIDIWNVNFTDNSHALPPMLVSIRSALYISRLTRSNVLCMLAYRIHMPCRIDVILAYSLCFNTMESINWRTFISAGIITCPVKCRMKLFCWSWRWINNFFRHFTWYIIIHAGFKVNPC